MTCPDPGLIAAHAEGRLKGAEAARVDEHIAGCADCSQVFGDTVEFALADGEVAGVQPPVARVAAPRASVVRPAFKVAAGLAIAAALVLAVGTLRLSRAPAPQIAQLAEAIGSRRFIEPRLTGGFEYGRRVILRSGETAQKLDAQPAAVIAAVARIRAQAEGDTSPKTLGALGITYLVSGDVAAAVRALESATAQEPDNPRLLSDLAAAYLARAEQLDEQLDEPADIPKALEAAEKAIILKDPPNEAWFNRALALEKLHLVDAARRAWDDYLESDAASGWADEARQHKDALPKERQSSIEEDKARVKAALDAGQAAVDRLADEDPSLLRNYLEDELLPAWAEAHLVGHPKAIAYRDHARLLGDALFRTTTDALGRDAANALLDPQAPTASLDPLRSQALGYRTLHEAKRLSDAQESSCAQYRAARHDLEAGGSPYSAWAAQQVVTACLQADPTAAIAELTRLDELVEANHYLELQGRVLWLQAWVQGYRGQWQGSLERYRSALSRFNATRDVESEAFIRTATAENLHFLGDIRGAWRERALSLSLLGDVHTPRPRYGILVDAVRACVVERMPRSALHFGTALFETASQWSRPAVVSDALIRRAGIHHSLGSDDNALADLSDSRRWITEIRDPSLSQRQAAETDALEGEILVSRQPERAVQRLALSLDYFRAAAPPRLPALHLLRARAQTARGRDDLAETDLSTGIEIMERERVSLRDAALEASFLDETLPLFDDMVRLQIRKRHDPARALAFVERGRARQLNESLGAPAPASGEPGSAPGRGAPILDPESIARRLPDGLALVYYVSIDDALFAWTLTRDGLHFQERALRSADLSRLVAAHRIALERRATLDVVRRTAARLHDELVRPLLPFLGSQRALIVIPDEVVQPVAFASLWDRERHRFLVEDWLLGIAPSGTSFVLASTTAASMTQRARPRALIVGNPRFDRRVWVGLPNLPGAEAEALEIARLYPGSESLMGSEATRSRLLEGVRTSQVVHYAGHAVSRDGVPWDARLVLAPDPRTGDPRAFLPPELQRRTFPNTRAVVLAACRTAGAPGSRLESVVGLNQALLAAGVPDVVASLWDIDDTLSRRFFVALHRALVTGGDPVLALRAAQLALLHDPDVSFTHPSSWAPFICTGGLDPHSLPKGDKS